MRRNRRRCRSFRLERPGLEEAWDIREYDSEYEGQNFISEPNSPRSKEVLCRGLFSSRMVEL